MCVGKLCRCHHLFVRGSELSVADVVRNGAGEQMGVLQDDPQRPAQIRLFDLVDIDTVIPDLSVLYIIKTVDQIGNRSLAGSGGAHKGDLLSRIGVHLNVMQDDLVVRISKIHAVQHHISLQLFVGDRPLGLMRMLPRPDPGPLL